MISHQYQGGRVGQVIKDGAAGLKEKRQVVLRATGHAAGADFGKSGAEVGVAIKMLEPGHLKAMGGVAAHRKLSGRHQLDVFYLIHSALRVGVKSA